MTDKPIVSSQLQKRVEKALSEKGLLKDGRALLFVPYGVGVRAVVLSPESHGKTVQERSAVVNCLRGNVRDQANGIIGALLASFPHARGDGPKNGVPCSLLSGECSLSPKGPALPGRTLLKNKAAPVGRPQTKGD